MKLEDRMRLSVRRRAGQVVLRSELAGLGSASQVSHVLKVLQRDGELVRLGSGVYAKARRDPATGTVQPLADVATLAREVANKLRLALDPEAVVLPDCALVMDAGRRRVSRKLALGGHEVIYTRAPAHSPRARDGAYRRARLTIPTTGVAQFVHALARQHQVRYTRTPADQWAETVTQLAGDEVRSGPVQDLLIALKRAGKLSADEMTALLVNYLRETRQGVRPV